MTVTVDGILGAVLDQAGTLTQSKLSTNVVGNGPAFSASAVVQTITSGLSAPTQFQTYNTPDFNLGSAFSTTTGKFLPTVAGYYLITASVGYGNSGTGTASVATCSLTKNTGTTSLSATGGGGYVTIAGSTIVYLNGTSDFLILGTMHNASASIASVSAIFSACLIRSA